MILVAGSANLDFVVRADHIPSPGETVLGRDFQTFPGGKGANQAVACARAGGVPTHMLLALGNLGPYLRRGQFAVIPAMILGMPALVGSWIGGSWVKAGYLSEPVELGVFAAAALVASWLLTRTSASNAAPRPVQIGARPGSILPLAIQGVLVGLLTGIAGVGGGFAIVPALVLLAGLPMQLACGTSLLLIVVNALVALVALGHWPQQSLPLMLPLLLGGAVGAAAGQLLAPRLSDRRLRQGFAALLVGSALLSGFEAIRRQSDLQSGANSHSNSHSTSTRQAWRPVEAGHDSKATGSTQQLRPFSLTSRRIPSRS